MQNTKYKIQIQNTRLVLKMAAPTSAWPLMPTHLSKQRLRCLSSVSIPLPHSFMSTHSSSQAKKNDFFGNLKKQNQKNICFNKGFPKQVKEAGSSKNQFDLLENFPQCRFHLNNTDNITSPLETNAPSSTYPIL